MSKNSQGNQTDVVVVGSGLCGAWAASQLVQHGLSVLLLEAGPLLGSSIPVVSSKCSRVGILDRQQVQSRHFSYWQHDASLFVDDLNHPYGDALSNYSWIRGRQLGGRSATWGGVALRFSDLEFKGDQPWPISSDDLAPYYSVVEKFHRVEGFRDGILEVPDGEAIQPISGLTDLEVNFRQIIEDRWPARRVINTRVIPRLDEPGQQWSNRSVLRALLPSALASGRLRVREDSIVSHLSVSSCGQKVESIACIDRTSHAKFVVSAPQVVLCASTIETIRILLNSRSTSHPDGIGNNRGLLGKKLLDKAAVCLSGDIPAGRGMSPQGFNGHGILIAKFEHGASSRQQAAGFGVAGWMQRANHPVSGAPQWALTAQIEVSSHAENRVEIDQELRDAWGIPCVRIHYAYSDLERDRSAAAESIIREMAVAADYRELDRTEATPGLYVHETGGAPMGTSPATSVINRENVVWGVNNLIVADGASFVSSGWQNPSLTMMAIASRAARLLACRLHR